MPKLVQKLVGIDQENLRALREISDKAHIGVNALIRRIISDHLTRADQPYYEVMTELADLRKLTIESVELSAWAIALMLVIDDDQKLSKEEATARARKVLDDAARLIPAIRRRKNGS